MDNDNDSRIKDIIYKRKNGYDIVNDPEAIASCKREQSRDVIDNTRLGSYDKYGNYIIIPEIKRELISMPKLIYNQYSSNGSKVFELKSSLPIFNDVFMKLVITGDIANLFICEQVNREAGGYLEAYDEVIDSLAIGTEERMPQSLIFRTYNIFDNPNDFGKELKDSKFDNILTRKVYLSLLAKELKNASTLDEKDAFKTMVSTLKQGGDYGKRVLDEFLARLKDRPAIFEISKAENYNKAINEVLISSLEVATTEQDKQNSETRQVYLSVLNTRDRNIEDELRYANDRVSEDYVKHIVDKAKQDFVEGISDELSASDEFYSKLSEGKYARRRTLDKPILKQGKAQEEAKTKEEKIKEILEGKTAKKTPKGVKLKASKGKKPVKKLKAGKKSAKKKTSAKKKKVKAKVKTKKKVKKAKPKKKVKAKRKKPKKAKIKSKKKVKKPKKKLVKKKSAKKKVKRKLAKKKLKGKKGKLKSKKKVKKPKKVKKASKLKVSKPASVKLSTSSPQVKKKKKEMSMAMQHNVLYPAKPVTIQTVSDTNFKEFNPYKKIIKVKQETPTQQPITSTGNFIKIKDTSLETIRKTFVSGKPTEVSAKNVMSGFSRDLAKASSEQSAVRPNDGQGVMSIKLKTHTATLDGAPLQSSASSQSGAQSASSIIFEQLKREASSKEEQHTPPQQSQGSETLNEILNNIIKPATQEGSQDSEPPIQEQPPFEPKPEPTNSSEQNSEHQPEDQFTDPILEPKPEPEPEIVPEPEPEPELETIPEPETHQPPNQQSDINNMPDPNLTPDPFQN